MGERTQEWPTVGVARPEARVRGGEGVHEKWGGGEEGEGGA